MALETGIYINDLVATNPPGTDLKAAGDDHLRLIKAVEKNSFAGFLGAVLVTGVDGGVADIYTLTPATALPSYTSKTLFEFTPSANNATTTPTLNVSGLGAKTIVSQAGAALAAADLVSGRTYLAAYDGTVMRLISVTTAYVDAVRDYATQLAFATALPAQSLGFVISNGTTASFSKTHTGYAQNEVKGADIASAATINLTTATGNLNHVTGTATITAITIPVGAERTIIFDGALTLTHSSALLLPGAANITTEANDRMDVRGDTAGAIATNYTRANGLPIKPGLTLIATLVPTVAAAVDFLSTFSSLYDAYIIEVEGVLPAANFPQLKMRFGVAGVSDSGSNYYGAGLDPGSTYNTAATSALVGPATISSGLGSNSEIKVFNANDATRIKSWSYISQGQQSSGPATYSNNAGSGLYPIANAISGLTFFWSGGENFQAVGAIRVFGINN